MTRNFLSEIGRALGFFNWDIKQMLVQDLNRYWKQTIFINKKSLAPTDIRDRIFL